jgi:sporulation protein YlmC with PRC-barrel domain
MAKPLRAAALCAAFAASSIALALAQTTPPQPAPTPSPGTPGQQPPMQTQQTPWRSPQGEELRASKLVGSSVRNRAGETIGDINEVVIGKDGKVAAVVLGVGGFLGLGERQVAVGFDSLHLSRDNAGRMLPTLDATKESLKSAPEWKWSAEERRSPTGTGTKPIK